MLKGRGEWGAESDNRNPVAPLVLAAAVLLIVGVLLGRMTAPDAATAPRIGNTAGEQGQTAEPKETEEGAIQFATDFLVEFPKLARRSSENELSSAIVDLISPSATSRTRVQLNNGPIAAAKGLSRAAIVETVPVAYQVSNIVNGAARVKVWAVSVTSDESATVAAQGWVMHDLRLEFSLGKWRIADWTAAAGPTPPPMGETGPDGQLIVASAAELSEFLKNAEVFDYAPAA